MIVLSHKMADNYGVPDVDNEVRNWDPYAQDAPGSLPETRRALEETAALVTDEKRNVTNFGRQQSGMPGTPTPDVDDKKGALRVFGEFENARLRERCWW